jgi:hypothetical protein
MADKNESPPAIVQFIADRARDHPEITGGLIQVLLWSVVSITLLTPFAFLYVVEYTLRPVFNAWGSVLWALFGVIAALVSLGVRLGIAMTYTYIAFQICGVVVRLVNGGNSSLGLGRWGSGAVGPGQTYMERYLGPERERGLTEHEREHRKIWQETMKAWEKERRAKQLDADDDVPGLVEMLDE